MWPDLPASVYATAGFALVLLVVVGIIVVRRHGWLALTGVVAFLGTVVGILWTLLRYRPPPTPSPVIDDARRTEQDAHAAAERERAEAVQAIEQRDVEERKKRPVDIANDRIRRRGAGLLCLAALLLPMPARAECVEDGAEVHCPAGDFAELTGYVLDLEKARALAEARATEADQRRTATEQRAEELEAELRKPTPLPVRELAIAGGIALVVGFVLGVLVAR